MNKFLLNIENILLALSGRPRLTQFNLNTWFWEPNVILFRFQLRQMLVCLIHLQIGNQHEEICQK